MTRIAFLGLGRMGHPMAERLLDAGHRLSVWNRTRSRGEDLATRGATLAETPAAAVRDSEMVITMLADPGAVMRVLSSDDGVLRGALRGAVMVDCSTVGPEDARAEAALCADHGLRFVEAPVLGSVNQARSGELVALAGGDPAAIDAAEPVLRVMAKQVVRAGAVGTGSALKLVMNLLIGGLTELAAEALVLGERAGVPREAIRETVGASVLASPFLGYKLPQLVERKFHPALFTTDLLLKDLNLLVHLGKDVGAPLPATTVIRDVYARTAAAGHGGEDFASVIAQVASEGGTR
ncbi:MAG TPA: NAD(P)-dependent oxidoreductase [Gemmatimonadaceae bacterium]|nr:NAD(P)-dependent oxidoreductase [Gemmatimonadaceae bacterium]